MKPTIYTSIYYYLRPVIPRRLQLFLRRLLVSDQRKRCLEVWPINKKACVKPEGWGGWPRNKKFALVLTHDVDTARGQERCKELVELEKSLGFRSSFNFVPERYRVDPDLRYYIVENGFEVGVHDLNHDGKLYSSKKIFDRRAVRINKYLREWNSVGFRSGSMHKNLEWIHSLNIEYDSSSYDTDPFEPWSKSVRTIFPFFVKKDSGQGYVELPYTLPQDFTLFVLMKEKNIDIWKRKIDWIVEKGGMVLLAVHPDYMNFQGTRGNYEEYPVKYYEQLLEYIESRYKDQYWPALPREVARFLKDDSTFFSSHSRSSRVIDQKKKKVAMIAYTLYPFDARVRREAETLADKGYEVLTIVPKESIIPREYLLDGVHVIELNISQYRGKSQLRYMLSYIRFIIYVLVSSLVRTATLNLDIIHVHNMPNFLVVTTGIHRLFGKKVILDIHDSVPEMYTAKYGNIPNFLFRLFCLEERLCCGAAHKIICVNQVQRDTLVERGIPSEKIAISMNVPDPKKFNSSANEIVDIKDSNAFKLVYHGTLVNRLGIDLIIRAVAELRGRIPDLEFHMVGDGDDTSEYHNLCKNLGVEKSVFFNEFVPIESLQNILKEMDVGVVANRKSVATELMLPVKMMEYIALNIPVIAPRLKAIQYYFSEDMVSFFEPEDISSLADCILEMYLNKDRRINYVKNAKSFLDKYGWDSHKNDFIDIYRSLSTPAPN